MESPVIRNSLPLTATRLREFEKDISQLPSEGKSSHLYREAARSMIGIAISNIERTIQELKFYEVAFEREKERK